MAISVSDVKKLKDMTSAGMMDCKKVLEESNGDMEKALKMLKEKGLADAKKRSDRETKEGGVYIKSSGNKIALCLIGCETDFVSKNEIFKDNVEKILEKILSSKSEDLVTYTEYVQDIIAKTKENIELKVVKFFELKAQEVSSVYIHGNNRIGVISIFETNKPELKDNAGFKEFANNISMHIAASNPFYISEKDVPQTEIEEQKAIFTKQMDESGKPANVVENIVKGKVAKYLSEICVLDQAYVKDDKVSVKQFIESNAKSFGADINLKSFVRYKIGA
jgi:elongation factor Ts